MANNKRIVVWCGLAFLIALILNSFYIFEVYQTVSPSGSDPSLFGIGVLLLILLIGIVILGAISLIGTIFKRIRKVSLLIFLSCFIYIATALICCVISDGIRISAFSRLAKRGEPLVHAIKKYELKYGQLPNGLENLVPEFLADIPDTEMGTSSTYEYKHGEEAQSFSNNPWCLVVYTANRDVIVYFPNQQYSEGLDGNVLERIKDWAYVYD